MLARPAIAYVPSLLVACLSGSNRHRIAASIVSGIVGVIGAGGASAQSCVRTTDLGFTEARAISSDGSTVVGAGDVGGGVRHALVWTDSTGPVDISPGLSFAEAWDVSNDGTVVVGAARFSAGVRAFRWTSALGLVDLGSLGAGHSSASAVSEDGQVIVGRTDSAIGTTAFMWTAATGMVPIIGNVTPNDVSADGSVVVGGNWRWNQVLGLTPLDPLPGATDIEAWGVSNQGDFVVGGLMLAGDRRAFVWNQQSGMELVPLVPGYLRNWAFDISGDGSTIVGSCWNPGGAALLGEGYRCRETTGALLVTDQVGGDQQRCTGVSFDGEYVAGGHLQAYRWKGDGADEVGVPYCSGAAPNSVNCLARTVALGDLRVASNDLRLQAIGLPSGSFGFFLVSRDPGDVFPVSNSQGRLCLGGFIGRYVGPGQILNSGALGGFQLAVDLQAIPQPIGSVAAAPGDVWHFQAWYRDANPMPTSNFALPTRVDFE